MKFKIGDIVIGNGKASKCYSITKGGCIGTVVDIFDELIVIRNENDGLTYTVNSDCFDLLNLPKEISKEEEAEFAAMIF